MNDLRREFEVVIVGAGPAGLGAACAAGDSGKTVGLIDETPWLGGQIWRGQQSNSSNSQASKWFNRVRQKNVTILDRTVVIGAPKSGLLLAENEGQPLEIRWGKLILATGARELFIPFPGWTLPGVIGPGGLLSLVKNGWPVKDKRIVIAGSGPLLLAVADGLKKAGAKVICIVEQAPFLRVLSFGFDLLRHPVKISQAAGLKFRLRGIHQHYGTWPVRAVGTRQLDGVILTDGVRSWTEKCDYLACGFGLVPNVELPLLLGCALEGDYVRVDETQSTTMADIFCAGEPTGIGGADSALVEGQIAGFAASGNIDATRRLFSQRAAWHRFRQRLAETFGLRHELKSLAADETLLCRCEDVTLGRMRQFGGWREAKLQTRCGMGACQGRVCGVAAKLILGWGMESVRSPVMPARVASLVSNSGVSEGKLSRRSN